MSITSAPIVFIHCACARACAEFDISMPIFKWVLHGELVLQNHGCTSAMTRVVAPAYKEVLTLCVETFVGSGSTVLVCTPTFDGSVKSGITPTPLQAAVGTPFAEQDEVLLVVLWPRARPARQKNAASEIEIRLRIALRYGQQWLPVQPNFQFFKSEFVRRVHRRVQAPEEFIKRLAVQQITVRTAHLDPKRQRYFETIRVRLPVNLATVRRNCCRPFGDKPLGATIRRTVARRGLILRRRGRTFTLTVRVRYLMIVRVRTRTLGLVRRRRRGFLRLAFAARFRAQYAFRPAGILPLREFRFFFDFCFFAMVAFPLMRFSIAASCADLSPGSSCGFCAILGSASVSSSIPPGP